MLMVKPGWYKATAATEYKHVTEKKKKKKEQGKEAYCVSRTPLFMYSSICSFEGGSATAGTDFKTPLGIQEIAAIILDNNTYQ